MISAPLRLHLTRPQIVRNLLDEVELSKHFVLGHAVGANRDAGKSALRADADAVHDLLHCPALSASDHLGCFPHPGFDDLPVLQLRILGRHDAQHDILAAGEEAQRFKATGSRVVVFQEERVVVEGAEELLRNLLVGSLAEMFRLGKVSCFVRQSVTRKRGQHLAPSWLESTMQPAIVDPALYTL